MSLAALRARSRKSPVKGTDSERATQRPTLAPIKTCDDDRRWSAVVPPHSRALTFIAIFDPDEGMIGFSGSSLLPLETSKDLPRTPYPKSLPLTPGFPHDAASQVLTAGTSTPAQSTPALSSDSTLHDMQDFLDAYHRWGGGRWQAEGEKLGVPSLDKDTPRASSTLMGLNEMASRTFVDEGGHRDSGCHVDTEDDGYDERFEDSGYDSAEGEASDARESFERPQVDSFFVLQDDEYPFKSNNERSHFSVTTTSTSNYVDLESPATPEPPVTPHTITFRPPAPEPRTPDDTIYSPYEDEEDDDDLDFLSYVKPRPPLPYSRSMPTPRTPRKTNKLFKNRSQVSLGRSPVSFRPAVSLPASPDVVLAREAYNFGESRPRTTSPSSYCPPKPRLTRVLSKGIMRMRKLSNASSAPVLAPAPVPWERPASADTNWVRVDLAWQPIITTHDLDDEI
ncbi:hypothetical protein PENSPDRAFT_691274 [Peniophora sp. CONT]|nr:hypothetical protein PENSPDRAFT_691274 [Peniophora sp. CONT]